jgi:hypothetical protein
MTFLDTTDEADPTFLIHLNGSPSSRFLDAYSDAICALREAVRALCAAGSARTINR